MEMKVIAHIHNDFTDKFGIPRQSGLLDTLVSKIVFEPEYRLPDSLRGIEEWSHLWLIWEFSKSVREGFAATVRPPRLGGNKRVGVFATRSPFRPNPIGISSVKLIEVKNEGQLGNVIYVSGADLMDGTPIYDIKPYLPYTDSHPEASGGFAERVFDKTLSVDFPYKLLDVFPEDKQSPLIKLLSQDPRPAVCSDNEDRIFGFGFAGFEIKFSVKDNKLTVIDVIKV